MEVNRQKYLNNITKEEHAETTSKSGKLSKYKSRMETQL